MTDRFPAHQSVARRLLNFLDGLSSLLSTQHKATSDDRIDSS